MTGVGEFGAECAGAVSLKLSPHQCHDAIVVPKTECRAVQRHKSPTTGHEVEQRLSLIRADPIDVRVQHQRRVVAQRPGIQIAHLVCVSQTNPACPQHRLEFGKSHARLVVPVVSQKQNAQFVLSTLRGRCEHRGTQEDEKRERTHVPSR